MLIFSERLRQLRKEHALTQAGMAERLNIKQQSYNRYEIGTGEPCLQVLVQIARLFDVSADYLLGITDY